MALSNKFGSLVLTTGNKSEMAVGYCTLYGDMCGALAVIADVFKTEIYRISRWVNRDKIIIPEASIVKPPSAELRPNQKDQDSLPDTKRSTPFCRRTSWNSSARKKSSSADSTRPWSTMSSTK